MRRKWMCIPALGWIVASSFLLLFAQNATVRRLDPSDVKRFLPDRVPLETEVIPVDNSVSSGLVFSDKSRLVVASLAVRGFSNEVRQKYQFILISETRINLGRWSIPSGIVGLGLEPQKGEPAPTRILISRDFSGAEIDRIVMNLDIASPGEALALTPTGEGGFELRIGKYVIEGSKK
jgi:hypothetical protein